MTEDRRDMWKAIDEIRAVTNDTHATVGRMDERIAAHMADPTIHTRPPCEHYKSMAAKLWAIAIASITALLTAIGSLLSKG